VQTGGKKKIPTDFLDEMRRGKAFDSRGDSGGLVESGKRGQPKRAGLEALGEEITIDRTAWDRG